ncbi:hypothetical protein GCM10025877_14340 [Agromyces mangrovi Wang et al. 2018]|nr:hypothetical protein GCM10025877_14340 [Agromyces mangrovi]
MHEHVLAVAGVRHGHDHRLPVYHGREMAHELLVEQAVQGGAVDDLAIAESTDAAGRSGCGHATSLCVRLVSSTVQSTTVRADQ